MNIKLDHIYNEDCLDTLNDRELNYDYCIFSPPDYNELDLKPIKDDEKYYNWLSEVFSKLDPNNNVITIVVSNRRFKRKTIPKNQHINSIMKDLGWDLLNEKIWIKSDKINTMRYNYGFVMSFGRKTFRSKNTTEFKYDTWNIPNKSYKNYLDNFPTELVKRCVENYTDQDQIVYDPFMGIGSTMVACNQIQRHSIGSEISKDTYELSQKFIK